MKLTATYICPVRGLAGLQPPEPARLNQAAKTAGELGLDGLVLPVLEESLVIPPRLLSRLLDEWVEALDAVSDAGLRARLAAPVQRVLALDWTPSYLVGASAPADSAPVFTAGRLRNLKPFDWWSDPSIIQKRIRNFRELVSAVSGHPGLAGWVILDGLLRWPRPYPQDAEWLFRSFAAEVRERDEAIPVWLSMDRRELADPGAVRNIAPQTDGLSIGGLDRPLRELDGATGPEGELLAAAYLGALAGWLWDRPVEVETGWTPWPEGGTDDFGEAIGRPAAVGLDGLRRACLADPDPGLREQPPWSLRPGLDRIGILNHGCDPKDGVPEYLEMLAAGAEKPGADDFIDLSADEYLEDPGRHFVRLWDHFR